MTLVERFNKNMELFAPFEDRPVLAVALSGGADSMALTLLAHEYVKKISGKIIAITIDHGLRKESRDEAVTIQQKLEKLSIEHHILTWDKQEEVSSNIQSRAREARYQLLTNFCREKKILHLLVAHHKDDQIETFIMRLERGSGVAGLCAMHNIHYFNNVRILRPLLSIESELLKNYLREENISWIEDPSNMNEKFTRIKLRNSLKFYGKLSLDRIYNTSLSMQRAQNSLNISTYNHMIRSVKIHIEGYSTINIGYFLKIPQEEAFRILSNILITIGGSKLPSRFESIEYLYQKIKSNDSFTSTLGGCKISLKKKILLIYREIPKTDLKKELFSGKTTRFDNRFLIIYNNSDNCKNIIIDYFDKKYIEKIKNYSNLIKNLTIPKEVIHTLPLLIVLDKVVAVPYINYYDIEGLRESMICSFQPERALTGIF